jgi:hypothetical protein
VELTANETLAVLGECDDGGHGFRRPAVPPLGTRWGLSSTAETTQKGTLGGPGTALCMVFACTVCRHGSGGDSDESRV